MKNWEFKIYFYNLFQNVSRVSIHETFGGPKVNQYYVQCVPENNIHV
jgi:hypothetical protein